MVSFHLFAPFQNPGWIVYGKGHGFAGPGLSADGYGPDLGIIDCLALDVVEFCALLIKIVSLSLQI
jgi:hypothetical protein